MRYRHLRRTVIAVLATVAFVLIFGLLIRAVLDAETTRRAAIRWIERLAASYGAEVEVGDVLKPYKAAIDRWLWPDVFKNQDTSVAKAKKAISDYKKAIGRPEGLAELMVFYCERAAGFSNDVAFQDEGYFDALVRMFGQALKTIDALPQDCRSPLIARLGAVRHISHNFGYGVGDDMDALLAEFGFDGRQR